MGTQKNRLIQKNRLNETVLLSAQNDGKENTYSFTFKHFVYLKPINVVCSLDVSTVDCYTLYVPISFCTFAQSGDVSLEEVET